MTDFLKIWDLRKFEKEILNFVKIGRQYQTHCLKNFITCYALYCSAIYFVLLRQCKVNPLLLFHGYTQRFYVVESYIWVSNHSRGKDCCVLIATMVKRNFAKKYFLLFGNWRALNGQLFWFFFVKWIIIRYIFQINRETLVSVIF
jgi:hypothetical protein